MAQIVVDHNLEAGMEQVGSHHASDVACSASHQDLHRAMKILVTGGAGYLGSVVAADLLHAGFEVVVYDNLSHGRREAVPSGAELVVGELGALDRLDSV